MRLKLHSLTAGIVGLAILALLPVIPVMGAAAVDGPGALPEISISEDFPDTLRIVAKNYAVKVDSEQKLINCIGSIKARPDDGLVFISSDTAKYFG